MIGIECDVNVTEWMRIYYVFTLNRSELNNNNNCDVGLNDDQILNTANTHLSWQSRIPRSEVFKNFITVQIDIHIILFFILPLSFK